MAKTAEQLAKEAYEQWGGKITSHSALVALANACFEEAAQVAESQTNHSGRLTGNIVIREIGERIRALESSAPGTAKQGGGKCQLGEGPGN